MLNTKAAYIHFDFILCFVILYKNIKSVDTPWLKLRFCNCHSKFMHVCVLIPLAVG